MITTVTALLPRPTAINPNDSEDPAHWLAGAARPAPGPQDQRQRDGDAALNRGAAVADADRARRQLQRDQRDQPARRAVATGSGSAAADAEGDRRDQGLPGAAGLEGRPDAALGGQPSTPQPVEPGATVDWSVYEPAIRRWEQRLGRLTPHPTQPGRHGGPVLAPRFVEHLMGLPPGWVTDLDLPRTVQLRALGNGVVPQQAAHAVALLLADQHQLTRPCTCASGDPSGAAVA